MDIRTIGTTIIHYCITIASKLFLIKIYYNFNYRLVELKYQANNIMKW
jgi:hypothetical protein